MKKLFFSAVALVAFSGVSMANTIEVEQDFKEEKGDHCQEFAMDFMAFYDDDEDISIVEYNQAFQDILNWCYSQNSK